MFWGLIMEPQRRYTQVVKKAFHISMAALDISSPSHEPSQIMIGFEGRNYLLCTLKKPDVIQVPLDLNFHVGSELSLASNGESIVHLSGYLLESDEEDDDEDDDEDVEEEEQVKDEEEEEKPNKKKNKKRKAVENGPPLKKPKRNTVSTDESSDEDESDDENKSYDLNDLLNKTFDSDEEGDHTFPSGSDDEEEEDDDIDEEDETEESALSNAESEDEQPRKRNKAKLNGTPKNEKSPIKIEPTPKTEQSSTKKKDKKNKQNNAQAGKNDQQKKEKTPNKDGKSPKNEKSPKKTLQNGLIIEDIRVGQGPNAKPGKFITVNYEGRLKSNNKVFDSQKKGSGFSFKLGNGEVIQGWDVGLIGMKVGGKRRIICPPPMAYGVKGSPPAIPGNSTLIFDVELKKIV